MDNNQKELLKKRMVALKLAIEDYTDALDMDERKTEKKPPKKEKEDDDE